MPVMPLQVVSMNIPEKKTNFSINAKEFFPAHKRPYKNPEEIPTRSMEAEALVGRPTLIPPLQKAIVESACRRAPELEEENLYKDDSLSDMILTL